MRRWVNAIGCLAKSK